MRTGIALGRPLVPRMGQMFQWPGGGVPPVVPLSSQQAGVPLIPEVNLADLVTSKFDTCLQRCEATIPGLASQPQDTSIQRKAYVDSLYAKWAAQDILREMPRLQGLGLGSPTTLGADGVPLLARSIFSIPLQAAATWVGFHTGSEETGWLSAAGYVVGIVGAIGTLVSLLGLVVGTAAEVAQ